MRNGLKILLSSLLLTTISVAQAENVMIGQFSSHSLAGWKSKEFADLTDYKLVSEQGKTVLKAVSNNTASGLFKEQQIDLHKTPYLNWSWKVENTLENLNEESKGGDDYAARISVVISGGLAFWKTKAINYVWASSSLKGHVWENAFAGANVMMIALRSKEASLKKWHTEKRNILADFKQQFGAEIRYIDAIAVMTDTDNSGGKATAFYGDIYFSKQ